MPDGAISPPPLSRETAPLWVKLPPPNRRRLVALLSKLLERQMAMEASRNADLKGDGDGRASSS